MTINMNCEPSGIVSAITVSSPSDDNHTQGYIDNHNHLHLKSSAHKGLFLKSNFLMSLFEHLLNT